MTITNINIATWFTRLTDPLARRTILLSRWHWGAEHFYQSQMVPFLLGNHISTSREVDLFCRHLPYKCGKHFDNHLRSMGCSFSYSRKPYIRQLKVMIPSRINRRQVDMKPAGQPEQACCGDNPKVAFCACWRVSFSVM